MGEEVVSWLKSMPMAPEYHPSITEFQDPISYIYKIEQEASKYGICKIIPPVPSSSKKATIANLNLTLSSANRGSSPTFTTRLQQVGFSPRKHQPPVQRRVWQSGEKYTLTKFEQKAKIIEKKLLMLKERLTPLEIETLYWKVSDVMTVGETLWNLRRTARANGSLLKFVEEDIPGVTSPMIYMGMLYSWFAWHVEDHDLHSLNYMHMGAGKTWYGVPMDAAFAFEEVIRTQAYRGEISPVVTFATLVEMTTIVSPEVLVKAGVPCCRLVQNPGEFVVTFPRAYHCGFSHGFNCAEALNMATSGWLRVAREAAIRRVSIDMAPMIFESQLLYDLAMSFSSSKQKGKRPKLQSSRLRERLTNEGDAFVKRSFVQDVMHSKELLHALGNGSPITLLSEDVFRSLAPHGFDSNVDDSIVDKRAKGILNSSYDQPIKKGDLASLFSCVTCGCLCFSCVAIVQPSKTAAHYLMSNEDVNVIDQGLSSEGKLLKSSSSTPEHKDIPALTLLALAYGDTSDSEEGSEPTKLPVKKDSLRLHVFCLDHAHEVEQRLRSVGGVHMLLLCHQDYREINDAARVMGKELGTSYNMWTHVKYKAITEQEKTMIQWALDDEETATGNQDWAVKMGIDIFYSAKLGCSSSYKKQMPYNAVIYNAFRQDYPSDDQSGRQKKITVAGRWCGKVWISNQVHPLLLVRDDDHDAAAADDVDHNDNQQEDQQAAVHVFSKMNVNKHKEEKEDLQGYVLGSRSITTTTIVCRF
ncbi:putative [histone H3]-dimethyl-L-lysine(36) demethylase [Helianthus annuus]|nr:putative [histone H3]-dimethyl-L-lysine(36) demethylase [Helianthus annuus]